MRVYGLPEDTSFAYVVVVGPIQGEIYHKIRA